MSYEEDRTRGSSVINPLSYKGDVNVQVWMDSRVLATWLRWMDLQGVHPRFMSEVVKVPMQSMIELMVNAGDVEMVDDTMEARAMLERRFRVDLNKGGRGLKNVLHNQVLTERRKGLAEEMNRAKGYDVSTPARSSQVGEDVMSRAMEIFNELSEEDKD